MDTIQIYSLSTFNATVTEELIQKFKSIVTNSFSKSQQTYFIDSKKIIEEDLLIKEILSHQLTERPLKYVDFNYTVEISEIPKDPRGEWFGSTGPNFNYSYKIQIIAKSVIYTCVKIMDENKYLVYQEDDKEIKTLSKNNSDRIFTL